LELPFESADALCAAKLVFNHKDPFDRALAAQSITRRMPILSVDSSLDALGAQCDW
jgi:PIN domain nuclease of toxin-antitoxin system